MVGWRAVVLSQVGAARAAPCTCRKHSYALTALHVSWLCSLARGRHPSHACQTRTLLEETTRAASGEQAGELRSWPDAPLPLQGDALDPQQAWRDVLKGAAGVVSTLGAFGSNEHMYKVRSAWR